MNKGELANFNKKLSDLAEIVEQTFHFENKIFELTQKVEKNKNIISKGMRKGGRLELIPNGGDKFVVNKDIKADIVFNKEEILKKFDKKQVDKMVDKKVVITDLQKMVKMLKSYGVPPKEFKKFIDTEIEINSEKVDYLIEIDELSIEELQGCYNVTFNEKINIKKTK